MKSLEQFVDNIPALTAGCAGGFLTTIGYFRTDAWLRSIAGRAEQSNAPSLDVPVTPDTSVSIDMSMVADTANTLSTLFAHNGYIGTAATALGCIATLGLFGAKVAARQASQVVE